ncbi:very short patch repair endonuclease [Bdellovibrio sp. GT3]|uniref:very short patch repair endonuclease n=1 Tax=Bdellovibrio sp. GT3 TaxID=3136282 RepID=UPI00404007A0
MDVLSKSQRSYCMSRIQSRHTSPERNVRQILRSLGVRYRLDSTLPGKPDIKIVGQNTVIFIDGCFWHKCPRHFHEPKNNALFWQKKIESNVLRDKIRRKQLRTLGYKVIRIWEHELRDITVLFDKIVRSL